jgi:2-amino-4-hydroxy-6-hydroxymethyldihydropteridine diphosphokinase
MTQKLKNFEIEDIGLYNVPKVRLTTRGEVGLEVGASGRQLRESHLASAMGEVRRHMPHWAFIGLGSNLGDRKANYFEAIERVQKLPTTRIIKQSSLYESEPLGDAKTWFVNAVIEIETESSADDLLKRLKAIETAMGRKRVRGKRWGSRIIDLDILFFDNEIISKRTLKVPHPELQNRKFVLAPLCELAPQMIHPKLGVSASELLAGLKSTKKIHLLRAS